MNKQLSLLKCLALRQRLVLYFSENNVHKLKNRYKFMCFVVAKIRKLEVRKSRKGVLQKCMWATQKTGLHEANELWVDNMCIKPQSRVQYATSSYRLIFNYGMPKKKTYKEVAAL
jgi:hypothetical protein